MRRRDIVAAAVGAVMATVLAGSVAWAAIPGDGGVYSACMLKNVGTVRLIDKSLPQGNLMSHCKPALEVEIAWNQKGQQGTQGPPGEKGDSGPPGSAGVPSVCEVDEGTSAPDVTGCAVLRYSDTSPAGFDILSIGGGVDGQQLTVVVDASHNGPGIFFLAANARLYCEASILDAGDTITLVKAGDWYEIARNEVEVLEC